MAHPKRRQSKTPCGYYRGKVAIKKEDEVAE